MFDDVSFARMARAAATGLVLTVLAMMPARAEDVFEVSNLGIDETAENELSAKYSGIAKAQQAALQIVFQRLVQRADYGRLPVISNSVLPTLIQAFDITGEKFGGGRYIATMSVRFAQEEVARALRLAGIPFAMSRSRPLVVLPVIDTGSATRLWNDPNPWLDSWARQLPNPGLFSLVMPDGDLADVTTINVNQALVGNTAAFRAVADKYRAAGVMVALATVRDGGRQVYVSLRFFGGGNDGQKIERRYEGTRGAGLNRILDQVVEEELRALENAWKERNLLDFGRQERMSVLVPIRGMADWLAVRERLSGMERVQSITLSRMSREEAEVDIGFVGNTEQLRAALAQQGLELVYTPERPLWVLRPGAGW